MKPTKFNIKETLRGNTAIFFGCLGRSGFAFGSADYQQEYGGNRNFNYYSGEGTTFGQTTAYAAIMTELNHMANHMDSWLDDGENPPGGKRIRFRKARAHFLSNKGTTLDTDINSIDLSKVKQSDFKYDKKTGRYVATFRLLNGDQRSNLEDGLVHGSITMELLPGNKNYAQVAWNDKYNCRCGMYEFDVNFSQGNLSMRDHMTIWGSLVNSRFTPAGLFVTGTPFLIRYNNVFKLTK